MEWGVMGYSLGLLGTDPSRALNASDAVHAHVRLGQALKKSGVAASLCHRTPYGFESLLRLSPLLVDLISCNCLDMNDSEAQLHVSD